MNLHLSNSQHKPPPVVLPALPACPAGERWLKVKPVAEKLGCTERGMRKRCAEMWEAVSLAVLCPPPAGGKPQWFVRSDADPALRDAPAAVEAKPVAEGLNDKDRARWGGKLATVQGFLDGWRAVINAPRRVSKEQFTTLYLNDLEKREGVVVSPRLLREWCRLYDQEGAAGLIDKRGKAARPAAGADPFLTQVRDLYMTRGRVSVRYCHTLALHKAREMGWKTYSLRKAQYFIDAIPMGERIYARQGETAYTNYSERYINRDWSTVQSNEQWGSDHHRLDLWVKVGESVDLATGVVTYKHKRPWITPWFDNGSRKLLAFTVYTEDPCSDHIIMSYRRAVEKYGVPEGVWLDNGKDFSSFALHGSTKHERRRRGEADAAFIFGIFNEMDVKAHFAQKYHGQSQIVERFFGTMEGQLCRLLDDSYCGNSPANRPEDLQARLDAGKAHTLEELVASVEAWAEVYNATPHTGQGMGGKSPNEVYAAKLGVKRVPTQAHLDLLKIKHTRPVKVSQNGVRCNGLDYGQYEPLLQQLQGKEVVVGFDPADLSRVVVYNLAGKFLCGAQGNKLVPANATAADMRAAMKLKHEAKKAELKFQKTRPFKYDSALEIMFRQSAEKAGEMRRTDPPPPNVRPVRSPFEAQLPEIQKAMQQPVYRKAAGAESMSRFSTDDLLKAYSREEDV